MYDLKLYAYKVAILQMSHRSANLPKGSSDQSLSLHYNHTQFCKVRMFARPHLHSQHLHVA